MAWQQISRLDALRHPLYGASGWLGFWSVMMIFGVPGRLVSSVSELGTVHVSDFSALDQLVPWASQANDVLILGGMLVMLVFAVLWFCRVRNYRVLYITTVLGKFLLDLTVLLVMALCADAARRGALGPFLSAVLPRALTSLLLSLPFIFYLNWSRRFRVTFEHKVRVGDVPALPKEKDGNDHPIFAPRVAW
jgi:hypothetical protein